MMLQINLLPGSKKTTRSTAGRTLSLGALGSGIRDPWLLGAAGAVVVAVVAVGLLFTAQGARAADVAEQLDRAVRDSTRYAKVLDARRRLTAERDSVMRQLQIIKTIDENRFNWAHILDEVSRALPAYTWLTTLEQTSKAPLPPGVDTVTTAPVPARAGGKPVAVVLDSIEVHPPLTFRIVGQTVDIQALTMFMRQMESSPFIQRVALSKSEIVIVDGKDVTQFELSAEYEVPPPGVVRTSPLVVPVR
ncbi:MAG: PilN domain-containing protein [Gemmatimonadota bacterium]|jgi:Tfp pilus assembly protein PilN|nr:PilN domain-containing protein [Gemmatimonadota bacterium]MDQ8167658.1 PilN domain-containing protein [Gemmatimonadota bacterium]MDQ8172995.1 PilN domain-containing protein [Gemmatimonadota bacterium]